MTGIAAGALLGVLGACGGTVESPSSPGGPARPGSANGAQEGLLCTTPAVGPAPMRRLTHAEYDNAVRDLLGDTSRPARSFAPDPTIGLFDNSISAQNVADLLGEQYLEAATHLARDAADLGKLTGCANAADTVCVRSFVTRFGRRAYRRPLTDDEASRLFALYQQASSEADPETGVRGVIAAVLASPLFLFRPEFGHGDETLPHARMTTSFELASRLAALLWASIPDDTLLDAAEAGQLATRPQVAKQARRMLADPKARPAVAAFYDQWLGLSHLDTTVKDASVYPEFDDALREAMIEETRRFIEYVIWEGDARLSTLLTARYTFVNGALAELYGVASPQDPESYAKVQLDPKQRAGVVTQASMLSAFARTDQSSPVKRGDWVRRRLLCHDLPAPPAMVPELPPLADGLSNRDRFAAHTENPACSGCHSLIDGLGFGLEEYDGIGRYRSEDQGKPVDANGMVSSTRDIDGPYAGGPALAARLADSEQVRDCVPTQWLRYALGRREGADDACSVRAARDAFEASHGNLRELMVALTQTDAFWHYRPADDAPPPVALAQLESEASWKNVMLTSQAGNFEIAFDLTPSANTMNGVTGLSLGGANDYTQLAVVVRLSPAGQIDARNGDAYGADEAVPYVAGSTYHVRLQVDIAAHRYSVFVTPPGGEEIALAMDYAFRGEQRSAQALDYLSVFAQAGSHTIENVRRMDG